MNRMELLLKELDFTYDQEDWYPPLTKALAGLTTEQAHWRPTGEAANTIWETVNHLLFYKERVLKLLKGEEVSSAEDNDATFEVVTPNEENWEATISKLEEVQNGLREVLQRLSDEDFDRPSPKRPLGMMVTSIILHDAYHTGQIVQTRKLQGSWPARTQY